MSWAVKVGAGVLFFFAFFHAPYEAFAGFAAGIVATAVFIDSRYSDFERKPPFEADRDW